MERKVSFFAVINANVRQDKRLSARSKLLYAEITALANENGYCDETNSYFAKFFEVSERTIIRLIKQLDKFGYIRVRMTGKPAEGIDYGRRIYIDDSAAALFDQETLTKMSPHDKNVTQTLTKMSPHTLNKNNNNIYIRAREKKTSQLTAVKDDLKHRVDGMGLTAQDAEELTERLYDFADMRVEIGKPMSAGRCVSILINALQKLSEGNVAVMTAMLDKAVFKRWSSVYQLRDDELEEVLGRRGSAGKNADIEEDCKWV